MRKRLTQEQLDTNAKGAEVPRAVEAVPPLPEPDTDLPEISTDEPEWRQVDLAVAALGGSGSSLYVYAGQLCHVVRDEVLPRRSGITRPANAPRIVPVSLPRLREELGRVANWSNVLEDGGSVAVSPPIMIVQMVLARAAWPGVAPLTGITTTPTIRPDGSLLTGVGYDDLTGLLYEPDCAFDVVPETPTQADGQAAAALVCSVWSDFPFAAPAHRSGCLAAVMSIVGRHAFAGPVPLFAIDKNVRAAGGSLLADTISLIATGRPAARMIAARDDAESRKCITSIARSGDPTVLLDNCEQPVGGPALNACLTGTVWQDRLLGGNEMIRAPLTAVWMATGNNLAFDGDTVRRVVHIRLDSPHERPEERDGFQHPDLLGWIASNRRSLVPAVLTILRAFVLAGRPSQQLRGWGSFEAWSSLVRAAVVFAGLPDPGDTREELRSAADGEIQALRILHEEFVRLDPHGSGMTAAQLVDMCSDRDVLSSHAALRDCMHVLCPAPPGKPLTARTIGNRLKRYLGRRLSDPSSTTKTPRPERFLDSRDAGNRGTAWLVRSNGDSGDSGDSLSAHHEMKKETTAFPTRERAKTESPESPESPESLGAEVVAIHSPRRGSATRGTSR